MILCGKLGPGQRLPSTRTLSASLGISRTTATIGYDELFSEGYIESRRGSGTYVSQELPESTLRAETPILPGMNGRRPRTAFPQLSSYGKRLTDPARMSKDQPRSCIDFRHGEPDVEAFPLSHWRRLLARHLRSNDRSVMRYAADAQGHLPLRASLVDYLARSRAVHCEAENITIVSGSQQALDIIARVLLDSGDRVAIEEPGYPGARLALEAVGAQLTPVPTDESGLVVEMLPRRKSARVKMVYVTPSHQFPTGAALTLPRRLELIGWADRTRALVLEDDYDSEYRYSGSPFPALQGLDTTNSVIYVGTFSKVMFPALRLAYVVTPPCLTTVFKRAKWLADRHCPLLEQRALVDFIGDGSLDRHIRKMRLLYGERRKALVTVIEKELGSLARVVGENAGMHLTVRLRASLSDSEIVRRAADAGVQVRSSRSCYIGAGRRGEFVFGYSNLTEREIEQGVRRLALALDKRG